MRRVVSENVLKQLSVISSLQMRRSLFANEFTTLPPKNHNLFVKVGTKKGIGEKRNCGHRLIMHSITRRGGEGEDVRRSGGGGVAPL